MVTGVGIHAIVYLAVNLLLVAIWVLAGGDADQVPTYLTHLNEARTADFWPIYVMLFWGVGLVIHAGVVFVTLPRRVRERRSARQSPANVTDPEAELAGDNAGHDHRRHRHGPSPRSSGGRSRPSERTNSSKSEVNERWVTVVFTDIVDSTRLNQQLGDKMWAKVLSDHRALVRKCVAEHDGAEVGTQGDGFLLRFDSPDAAVACAASLQRQWSIARLNRLDDDALPALAVRIGMHSGEVVHDEEDLVGRVINLASRVTDVATSGEILVTEQLADHLSDDVELIDRGLNTLKGFDRPRHLLAVDWKHAPPGVVAEAVARDKLAEQERQ